MASLTASAVAQCWWGRGGEEKTVIPHPGWQRGLGSQSSASRKGLPYPLWKGPSLTVPFSFHEMKRCREAPFHHPSPPTLAPMAAARGQQLAPLLAILWGQPAHWLECVTWPSLEFDCLKGAWGLSSAAPGLSVDRRSFTHHVHVCCVLSECQAPYRELRI